MQTAGGRFARACQPPAGVLVNGFAYATDANNNSTGWQHSHIGIA